MKCRLFDGRDCTATGIALTNVHRHEEVCANHPNDRQCIGLKVKTKQQLDKRVKHWINKSEFALKVKPNDNLLYAPTFKSL